jgi:hypothetical protein
MHRIRSALSYKIVRRAAGPPCAGDMLTSTKVETEARFVVSLWRTYK